MAVYESRSEQRGVTAIVTENTPESYSVSLRHDATGKTLPYTLRCSTLEQAKTRADRWAQRGGPMR